MKISIVTIAFNAEATIADAARSVTEQERDGFELEYIIVDGASTDGTLAGLEPYRHAIDRIISEPDSGLYDAMNKGVAAATGDFVGILNADDAYAHPRVLALVAAALKAAGSDALYGDLHYVAADGSNRIVRKWKSGAFNRRAFLHGWMPPHPTFFLSADLCTIEHGLFSLELQFRSRLRVDAPHALQTPNECDICARGLGPHAHRRCEQRKLEESMACQPGRLNGMAHEQPTTPALDDGAEALEKSGPVVVIIVFVLHRL